MDPSVIPTITANTEAPPDTRTTRKRIIYLNRNKPHRYNHPTLIKPEQTNLGSPDGSLATAMTHIAGNRLARDPATINSLAEEVVEMISRDPRSKKANLLIPFLPTYPNPEYPIPDTGSADNQTLFQEVNDELTKNIQEQAIRAIRMYGALIPFVCQIILSPDFIHNETDPGGPNLLVPVISQSNREEESILTFASPTVVTSEATRKKIKALEQDAIIANLAGNTVFNGRYSKTETSITFLTEQLLELRAQARHNFPERTVDNCLQMEQAVREGLVRIFHNRKYLKDPDQASPKKDPARPYLDTFENPSILMNGIANFWDKLIESDTILIVGESGQGKTALSRLMANELKPTKDGEARKVELSSKVRGYWNVRTPIAGNHIPGDKPGNFDWVARIVSENRQKEILTGIAIEEMPAPFKLGPGFINEGPASFVNRLKSGIEELTDPTGELSDFPDWPGMVEDELRRQLSFCNEWIPAIATPIWQRIAENPGTVMGIMTPMKLTEDTYHQLTQFYRNLEIPERPDQLWHQDKQLITDKQDVQNFFAKAIAAIFSTLPQEFAIPILLGAANGIPVDCVPITHLQQENPNDKNIPLLENPIGLSHLMILQKLGLARITAVDADNNNGHKLDPFTARGVLKLLIDPKTGCYSPEMGLEKILKTMAVTDIPSHGLDGNELLVTQLRSKIKSLRTFSNILRQTGVTGEILGDGLLEICYNMVILANTYGHYQ